MPILFRGFLPKHVVCWDERARRDAAGWRPGQRLARAAAPARRRRYESRYALGEAAAVAQGRGPGGGPVSLSEYTRVLEAPYRVLCIRY